MGKRLVCVLISTFVILISVVNAESNGLESVPLLPLEEVLESHAQRHAEHIDKLLRSQTYLDYWVLHTVEDSDLWETVVNTNFCEPRKADFILRPMEDIELLTTIQIPEEERTYLSEFAAKDILLLPLRVLRDNADLSLRMAEESLTVCDAALIPELDDVAYVIQLYENRDEVQLPMLVTVFVPLEDSIVMIHTEIVYGNKGDTETLFYSLLNLICSYTGEFDMDSVVIKEY